MHHILNLKKKKGWDVLLSPFSFDCCDSYGVLIVNFPLVAVPTVTPLSFL